LHFEGEGDGEEGLIVETWFWLWLFANSVEDEGDGDEKDGESFSDADPEVVGYRAGIRASGTRNVGLEQKRGVGLVFFVVLELVPLVGWYDLCFRWVVRDFDFCLGGSCSCRTGRVWE
jgi:hypothetical protein